jgi:DNA-binding transcriptional ArsR family regulator
VNRTGESPELPEPPAELVIGDVEQLRAASDPLRLQILELMTDEPRRAWSAKELAEALRTKQTKLYHHIGLLEERGFVRVAETRLVSGIQERRYQASARSFRVDRSVFGGGDAAGVMSATLDALFDKARAEIVAGVEAGLIDMEQESPDRRRMAMWATHARLSPASVRKVMRQIERLADIDDLDTPDGQPYGLVVSFYPRATKDMDR